VRHRLALPLDLPAEPVQDRIGWDVPAVYVLAYCSREENVRRDQLELRAIDVPARAGSSSSSSSGPSDSSRLAAGRMPAPAYPSEARRKGQTGTVLIEFTVDASGRVISAYAKSPSPWPLLNEEAVRTVRRWKFPPGGVMKLQRPIIFQLR
jgi:protein TonB